MTVNWLNSYTDKEETEWANFWYDKANLRTDRRLLLVGDSVARQARRTLAATAGCPVDLFGTSAALRDSMYWDQFDCFFKNGLYAYDAIIVWVGNHSRMSEDGASFFTEHDYRRFEHDFNHLIDRCLEHSPKVIVLTTLHMFKSRNTKGFAERLRRKFMLKPVEIPDEENNVVVEGKNRIMKSVAEKRGLLFHDIDADLMASRYWHDDFIHYMPQSNPFVAAIIKSLL